uniref:Uncharacterized protein n=1 Tax=Arundo donax TaxID=35708 RepID=A0A0A9F458_ARUDO
MASSGTPQPRVRAAAPCGVVQRVRAAISRDALVAASLAARSCGASDCFIPVRAQAALSEVLQIYNRLPSPLRACVCCY